MIERLREKLLIHRGKKGSEKPPHTVLRGNAHNIIVVKAPCDIFTEAIFILKDDYYLRPSASAGELLRQARAAAEDYTASVSVRPRREKVLCIVLSILLVLETVGLAVLRLKIMRVESGV